MSASEKPLVYLVLGAAGSGRREVLADLIADGLEESDRPAVMFAEGEVTGDFDDRLPQLTLWTWENEAIDGSLPAGATHVFFVTHGRHNPVDQIEAFKSWLAVQGGQLARVLCIVNCGLVEKQPPLRAWFEACIHFADVVLLTRREGVANKWLSDFLGHFQGQFYPCLFELVKAGRVRNPRLVLDPQARRLTHFLDDEQDWVVTGPDGEVIDADDEDASEGDEEVQAAPEEDPYLEKDAAGRRMKRIPDVAKYLEAKEEG
ncbi:MAG TPA: hypothetical protein VG838_00185 [Opitutaceae bacterium]|nr:hypothetical protein [Opitutaceae bacterium]